MKKLVILLMMVFLPSLSFLSSSIAGRIPDIEKPDSGMINGHEWVDLGLSVKWATCNIGASSPTESGWYFAWGETSPKEDFNWGTLKYCSDGEGNQFSKYVTDPEFGAVDNKGILEEDDDAAHVNWGGPWRLPTKAEADELRTMCTWTKTIVEGKNCYLVTSNVNGNSIILPAAGIMADSDVIYEGLYGCYWTSSLIVEGKERGNSAAELYFNAMAVHDSFSRRHLGRSIRPVAPSK